MQSLDTGNQEDRVPHCVVQPVVLLLPFNIAAPSEDNQTDYILLDMFVLVQLVLVLPFL